MTFLLEEAEEKVGRKIEGILRNLYWQLGFCLREYSEKEITTMSEELALLLEIDKEMLETAYFFYKKNPLKNKVTRWSA